MDAYNGVRARSGHQASAGLRGREVRRHRTFRVDRANEAPKDIRMLGRHVYNTHILGSGHIVSRVPARRAARFEPSRISPRRSYSGELPNIPVSEAFYRKNTRWVAFVAHGVVYHVSCLSLGVSLKLSQGEEGTPRCFTFSIHVHGSWRR